MTSTVARLRAAPVGERPRIVAGEIWDTESPRQIMAAHARTSFDLSTRFLPPDKRRTVVDLYAFFRTLDDLVDSNPEPHMRGAIDEILESWLAWFRGPGNTPPMSELAEGVQRAIQTYDIPRTIFAEFIDGVASDLHPRVLATETELDRYCYQVASTVGIAMAHVLGTTTPEALLSAASLGAAMQRTNILRDVGDDLRLDRVYIPQTVLARYGLRPASLFAVRNSGSQIPRPLRALMRDEIRKTRHMYSRAMSGIWLLPPDSRFPILLACRLYRTLLAVIERNGHDSINLRAATTRWDKARELAVSMAMVRLGLNAEDSDARSLA